MRGETGTRRPSVVESSASEGFMTPLHAHRSDEAVRLLQGRMTIFAGTETIPLEPGETFVVAAGVTHAFLAESPRTRAVFATYAASPGRYEDFLRAAGPVAVDSSGAPAWSQDEDARAIAAIAAAADVTVLGPPGALPAGARDSVRAA
ncbi:MAG: cupin domain-containing protein [Gaiellaceae bacterium]